MPVYVENFSCQWKNLSFNYCIIHTSQVQDPMINVQVYGKINDIIKNNAYMQIMFVSVDIECDQLQ